MGPSEDRGGSAAAWPAGKEAKPVAALPEGRPIKDAIDMELEALRKKAAE